VVGVKALDCSGEGSVSDIITGIDWAQTNCPNGHTCIISLSLGASGSSSSLESALQSAYNSGFVVTAAGGNDASDACDFTPASVPYVISVGATDIDDLRAAFSNFGTCLDVFAPGVNIPSSYIPYNDSYRSLSGTSQATPHVAGTAALYLGNYPSMKPGEVYGAIYASASFDKLYDTLTGSPNRLLYSLVDLTGVPTTPSAACGYISNCTILQGSITELSLITYAPTEAGISVDSVSAQLGYFQVWLEASGDLDLSLQFYSGGAWNTLATSSGSTGTEWIQFSTKATQAGSYRFAISTTSTGSSTYKYTLYYEQPASEQAGTAMSAASSCAPFWLVLYRAMLSL